MKLLAIALCGLLAGCGGATVVQDRPVTVKVPVPVACAGKRPPAVVPLDQQYSGGQWNGFDVKQKAALVAKQGLDYKTYGENLNAATAGCP